MNGVGCAEAFQLFVLYPDGKAKEIVAVVLF